MSNAYDTAFPLIENSAAVSVSYGLTKLELFSAMAMQAMIQAKVDVNMRGYEGWREEFSREAVRYADSLLIAIAAKGDAA